jgi:hypothetical protein
VTPKQGARRVFGNLAGFGVAHFASPRSDALVSAERIGCQSAYRCVLLNLSSEPYTELQDPLKLLRAVKPAIVVADWMSGKVIIYLVLSPERMRKNVISLPISLDQTAADVTAVAGLIENRLSFFARERLPSHLPAKFSFLVTPCLSQ